MLYYHETTTGDGGGGIPDSSNSLCCGNIYITNITSTGIVSNKIYLPETVPANSVLVEATTDSDDITIHFVAESSTNQSPKVTISGTNCINLQQFSNDRRLFFGSITVQLNNTGTFKVQSDTGKYAIVNVIKTSGPPVVTDIVFENGYPSGQSEVKENDIISVKVTFSASDSEPDEIIILDDQLAKYKLIDVNNTELDWNNNIYTATFNVSARFTGDIQTNKPIALRVKNSFGTISDIIYSSNFGSDNPNHILTCCDLKPSFIFNDITYPNTQTAFKGNEQGSIDVEISNFTSLTYSSPNNDFTITNVNVYDQDKNIQCNNPNNYNDSNINYRITANRSNNGTNAIYNTIIEVADTAPTVTVYHTQTALQSSELGETYTIYADSNQNLSNNPTMEINIPISGLQLGSFTGSGKNQQNNILIKNSDSKGTGNQTWKTTPTNNAGILASISGIETVKGFVSQDIELAAFATDSTLQTAVTDVNNLVFSQNFKTNMHYEPIGTQPPVVGGQTIDAINQPVTIIKILDTQAANSSSQESIITISEVV